MKKIIATVGTSLFNNFQQDEVKDKYGRDYASISIDTPLKNIENRNPNAAGIYDDEYKHYIRRIRDSIEDYWLGNKFEGNKQASAEIASILKIAQEEQNEIFEVHLIATDTLLSVLAAEMIADWFNRNKSLAENVKEVLFQHIPTRDFKTQEESDFVIKDLRIEVQGHYEKGFMNLIGVLDKLYVQCKKAQQPVIFNITGGYKAIIPVMTIYGQLRGITLKYIYDESDLTKSELIFIENLPLNFDWGVGELFSDFITEKEVREQLKEDDIILKALQGHKIIRNENRELTVLGALLAQYIEERMFEGKSAFGFFAEYKVYEALIEDLRQIPKRGKEYWWDKNDKTMYSESPVYEKDDEKEVRIEIDLLCKDDSGMQTWYEVKPYSKSGLTKAYQQMKEKLLFLKETKIGPVEKFVLVLYKFDFQKIVPGKQIDNLKELFNNAKIEFEVWYFDIPINFDKEKINNKNFFERKIELRSLTTQYNTVITILSQK